MPPSEGQLQAKLLLAAPHALPDMRLFRRNVGRARLQGGHVVQFAIAGQCDLYAIVRGGGHLEIELKASSGRLSTEQDRWRAWCSAWGIPHVILKALPEELPDRTVERWTDELSAIRQIIFQRR